MSEKQLWVVTRTVTGKSDYISTETYIDVSEEDARNRLRRFREICTKQDMFLPTGVLIVSGECMVSNPAYVAENAPTVDQDTGSNVKWIPNGNLYHGMMKRFDIDPDSYLDSEREFTVEMEVTRTYNVSVVIDEAKSIEDANDQARDRLFDGELEDDLDVYDDQDFDIQDTYET